MAMLKCKMCGGNLEVSEGTTVCECEYCGTTQTVPKAQDDVTANLFNRANNLRIKCEFDKAQEIYEKIVSANPNESEAYWGIVLCKFGIEYVEDPATFKKIPTCHRTQLESVQTDVDYKAAIENADSIQRNLYESEAAEIDRLQRDILAIVHNEDPFDVFICYKETDENGKRTNDSVIANDIYHQLTQEGFKVFYAAITLEDKLGQAYEPYIFAALTSAKVMLVIGSKPEYFNAVWVKNEWSRYLKIMKNDRSKLLIPCYKDMDAYELPEEFSHLQAQDMSKIGFINDVIRGIKKVIVREEVPVVPQTVVNPSPASTNIENLLKRGFISLEDGKWDDANNFFEQVLNENVEEARAYLGKLMAAFKANKEEDLVLPKYYGIDENENYKKILRFGSAEFKDKISEYNFQNIYNSGCEKMSGAINGNDYLNEKKFFSAKKYFDRILEYKDSSEKSAECVFRANDCIYNKALSDLERAKNDADCLEAKKIFDEIPQHRDSVEKSAECLQKAENLRKDDIYNNACHYMEMETLDELKKALTKFQSVAEWKDSPKKIEYCNNRIKEIEDERAAQKRNAERAKKQRKRNIKIACGIVTLCIIGAIITTNVIIPNIKYSNAVKLMNKGDYRNAWISFIELKEYKNSKELCINCINYLRSSSPLNTISASDLTTVGLTSNGTVVAVGKNDDGRCDVSDWQNIVAVSAGSNHTIGLKANGTVVAVGKNDDGRCNVSDWTNIKAISAGYNHTLGLKENGTVVAVGKNDDGRCNVSDWTNIKAISAGYHTVGLKENGTVVAVGNNDYKQCDVSDWTDIVAISAGNNHTVGLRLDGTVVAVGDNNVGQCNVSDWKDIVAISAGYNNTVGINADGTVVAVGNNFYGQCDVANWTGIVAISTSGGHTVGLKNNGTVIAVGDTHYNQCNVSDWKDIAVNN